MKSINRYTTNVRKQVFLKSIRTQQRQQIKAQRRANILELPNFTEQLWRFRTQIYSLSLSCQQARIFKFFDFIKTNMHAQCFIQHLKTSHIMEDLIEFIIKQLYNCSSLEATQLVSRLFQIVYQLVARSNIFMTVLQKQFNQLLFALFRYPCNQNSLDKLSKFFTCIEHLFDSEVWRAQYERTKLIAEEIIIEKLLNIYIQRDNYSVNDGSAKLDIQKRSTRWFKNAIKCLQIVYSLLQLYSQRGAVWQAKSIKESLYEGLNIFVTEKNFHLQNFESETDSDTFEDEELWKGIRLQKQESNLYFISLILDILMIRQTLLEQRQIHILKSILQILLKQINKYNIVNFTAIKIIKILYQQVIFDSEDLNQISNNHPSINELIQKIIDSDYL